MLYRELGPPYEAFDGAYLTLKPGTSLSALSAAAQALTKRYPSTGGQVSVADQSVQEATVERAIRPQAVTLALFAAALALTALLIVGQVAVRLLIGAAGDNASLAALGMTRRQLLAAGLAEVGVAVTVAGARRGRRCRGLAADPDRPGQAGRARPRGQRERPASSASGSRPSSCCCSPGSRSPPGGRRQARGHRLLRSVAPVTGRNRRPLLADRLALAGAPLAAVTGVRFALAPGHGRDSVPVRSALLGLAVAVAAVGAAVTFGTNLLRLVDTPALYGQTWDVLFDGQFGSVTAQQFNQITGQVPQITDVTFGLHGTVSIGTTVIPAIGLAPGTGPVLSPTILDRAPARHRWRSSSAPRCCASTGCGSGQHVTVSTLTSTRSMLITGSAVFPYFGQGSFTPTDVGEGAETDRGRAPAARERRPTAAPASYNFALIIFAPGAAKQAGMAMFQRHWACSARPSSSPPAWSPASGRTR